MFFRDIPRVELQAERDESELRNIGHALKEILSTENEKAEIN